MIVRKKSQNSPRLKTKIIKNSKLMAMHDSWANLYLVLPIFGVMGNMLSSHKRLEDATTSAASGQ